MIISEKGIDLGYQSTLVGAPRAGGIDVLLNDYSQRKTASMVCFGDKQREIGESAKAKAVMKILTTITNFKLLIGRRFDDPAIQEELKYCRYKTCAAEDGTVAATVKFMGETRVFTITQILGMLLAKIKRISEEQLKTKVSDCVVGVPVYFNDAQRHAVLVACKIAQLNCLRLFNETTAVAISYGIYKTDHPAITEKPRRVVFADLGHSSLQLSCAEFNVGKLTILAHAFNTKVGGRAFDALLCDKFCQDIQTKYKKNVRADPKAYGKLELESEKLKQTMSSISNEIPLNIECLIDDTDVSSSIDRESFEKMSAQLLKDIEATCYQLVENMKTASQGKVSISDIDSVEIVGGAVRTPAVKKILASVFGKELSTTLNLDEAVARGCALEAAIKSPNFRVRNFETYDKIPFTICLNWKSPKEESSVVYTALTQAKRIATQFQKSQDMEIRVAYQSSELVTGNQSDIANISLQGILPDFDGGVPKVNVEWIYDDNGCIHIDFAKCVNKLPPAPEVVSPEPSSTPAADTVPVDSAPPVSEPKTEAVATVGEVTAPKSEEPAMKKQKLSKTTQLKVVEKKDYVPSPQQLTVLIETELDLASSDRKELEKSNAKNALEEYMYSVRDSIEGELGEYIEASERAKFSEKLSQLDTWLYEEGEDCSKSEYIEKLKQLKDVGDSASERLDEFKRRPSASEAFQKR